MITSANMDKGLEFDCVIVPFASEDTYNSEIDKRMLYVACTRAMHELSLTFTGNLTRFINFEPTGFSMHALPLISSIASER